MNADSLRWNRNLIKEPRTLLTATRQPFKTRRYHFSSFLNSGWKSVSLLIFLVALSGCTNYYQKGTEDYKKGDYKAAIEDLNKALEKNPNDPASYYELSYVYRDFKDAPNNRDFAYECANKAISLCPKNNGEDLAQYYFVLADLYRVDSNYKEANTYYKKSIDLNPDDYQAQFFYGVSLCEIGSYRPGVDHIKKSLKIKPDYQNAKNFLDKASALGYK